jgi:hypothetical protein
VKEWIIKRMAINMVISEKVIDTIVTHQFDSANDALNVHHSVELSGFGKFFFNMKKAISQMDKYMSQKKMYEEMLLDVTLTEKKRLNTITRLDKLLISIKTLKPKINESESDI